MKKLLLLSLATLALCLTSSAATLTLNCNSAPINVDGGNGNILITCPALNPIFFTTLNGVSLTEFFDYLGGLQAVNSVSGAFTPVAAGGGWNCTGAFGGSAGTACGAAGASTLNSSGGFSSGGAPSATIVQLAGFANGPFTINVVSTVTGGAVQGTGAFANVTYTYDTSTGGVPEPSTFALLGSALVGIGMLARRKR